MSEAEVNQLETPAITIDLDQVENNIARTQQFFDKIGLALRPHIKTHKIPELARWQMAAGARGICAQKMSEAEIMINEANATDIFLPYNIIGSQKIARLSALLAHPGVSITVGADSVEAADAAQAAATQASKPVRVMIECDTGYKRAGLSTPLEVAALASYIARHCPMIDLLGLFTFPTHLTNTPIFFDKAVRLLALQGQKLRVFSGGGTPIQWQVGGLPHINEHRTGTYIFNDRNTLGAGAATLDECALHVTCTVISRPNDTRAIIDGGSKTFSSDLWLTGSTEARQTYGLVVEYPDAVFYSCSEEHGNLDFSGCSTRPRIGERLTIIPNHACTTTNMHDKLYGVRAGKVDRIFSVAGRGKIW